MKQILILSIFVILSTQLSFADGNRVGNGGGAWVCRSQGGEISWLQLVDLFEAQAQFGLTLSKSSEDYRTTAAQVLVKMSALPGNPFAGLPSFIRRVDNLAQGPNTIYVDERLPVINDSLYFAIPRSSYCRAGRISYEQVVNYQDNGIIFVQGELFRALSEEEKSALIVHEAIYAFRRSLGDVDSINSRRIVGLAFSNMSQNLFAWHLKFLMQGTAPVYPRGYDLHFSKINSDGSIEPLSDVLIGLTGWFTPQAGAPTTLWARSNHQGQANIDVDGAEGFYFSAPKLSVRLSDENWYSGNLPPNGWATSLSASPSNCRNRYSCESSTLIGSQEIHVICVDNFR